MKINEFANRQESNLNFDVVEDAVIFMRNDPMFYRKHYFPTMAKMADLYRKKKEINTTSVLGSMVDNGLNSYCKKFKIARRPADLFTMEDRQAILDKISSEELKMIEKGEY
jgi:hypothetical protein